jgi:predicted flap endonuclease-1-like 5' DNA nuclease
MGAWAALVLGILIGWLVEWLIDYLYWRRRPVEVVERVISEPQAVIAPDEDAAKQATIQRLQRELAGLRAELDKPRTIIPDELQVIKGIGPEIERRLYSAGIVTFEQLGAQTPESLEAILGATIKRLSDEQSLIDQARKLALQKK